MLKLLRTNPDLRALFIAQVISFMGDWFTRHMPWKKSCENTTKRYIKNRAGW